MPKPEKMLLEAAESPASGARFVGQVRLVQDTLAKNRTQSFDDLILHVTKFLAMLTLLKPKLRKYENARAKLAKTHAEKMTLQTKTFARKKSLTKKPEPNSPKR